MSETKQVVVIMFSQLWLPELIFMKTKKCQPFELEIKKSKIKQMKTIKSESPSKHRVEPKCCSHVPFYYKEHKQRK